MSVALELQRADAVSRQRNGSGRTTVLVAQEDSLLSSLLMERLSLEDGLAVVGSVTNAKELGTAVQKHHPDVLLLDLQWSAVNGQNLLEQISATPERPNIVALSGEEHPEVQVRAARGGARGFVPKSRGPAAINEAIQTVGKGGVYFTRQVSEKVFDEFQRLARGQREQSCPAAKLSDREREVLVCVADGMTNREIAEKLFMSVHTVKLHIQRIFRKLDIPNRTEAAVFAVREGLVDR